MRYVKLVLSFAAVLVAASLPLPGQGISRIHPSNESERDARPGLSRAVDVVFCLDTSGSMEHLLGAARARVWDVVNELAEMSPTPALRVGLLTYGSDESTEEQGWVVRQYDLTDDLDTVYAKLMALTVAGNQEHVGRVLDEAVHGMSWSRELDALKIVFIAGNESAEQGDRDFKTVSEDARADDIIVNALYAGSREQGIAEKWHEVAQHGRGNFSAIDAGAGTIQISTPQDETLLQLNAALNETYLPYGPRGEHGLANQVAQDGNASRLGVQSCSSRIVAKGSALYTNASWDLVDALQKGEIELSSLRDEDLPEVLRSMSDEERIELVNAKRAEREAIQQQIQKVSAMRAAHVQKVTSRGATGRPGLGDAMREALRDQAGAVGFTRKGN